MAGSDCTFYFSQSLVEHFPADTRICLRYGGFVLWVELNSKVDVFRLRTDDVRKHIAIVSGEIFSASFQMH